MTGCYARWTSIAAGLKKYRANTNTHSHLYEYVYIYRARERHTHTQSLTLWFQPHHHQSKSRFVWPRWMTHPTPECHGWRPWLNSCDLPGRQTQATGIRRRKERVTEMRRNKVLLYVRQHFKKLERSTGPRQTFSKTRHCSTSNDDQRWTFLKK